MTARSPIVSRVTVTLCIAAWLAVGLAGVYRYLERYVVYRGFPAPATPAGIARGTVREVHFHSAAVDESSRYLVYLPPGYGSGRRYPVLYLLHGFPGKFTVFLDVGAIAVSANVLIAHHQLPPLILVMPAGHQGILHGDTEWANTSSGRWMEFVLDVVRDVDSRFATIADRQHRGLAGDSEGAYGAVNVALHHPDLFSVIESWSGYFTQQRTGTFASATAAQLRDNSPAQLLGAVAPQLRRLGMRAWLYQGRTDSTSPRLLRDFAAALAHAGADVHVGFFPGGHDWGLWRAQTPRMLAAAGRWFQQPPRAAAHLASTGTALPDAVLARIRADRHRRCLALRGPRIPRACRMYRRHLHRTRAGG